MRHRLPAHRHREEHGVPHLDAGRHVRAPGWTTSRRSSTRPRTASASRGCSASPTTSRRGATVIRVLMMELNRISSHLVCLATGGMEIGALTVMTIGFRERELVLDLFELITGLRMNHAYIRPGGVAQDLPPGALEQDPRVRRADAQAAAGVRRAAATTTRSSRRGSRASATSTSPAAWRSASPARCCARPACRWDLRKTQPYCGYETYEFDVRTWDTADAYGRFLIRLDEMGESLRIVEQCLDRLQSLGARRSWSPTRRSPGRRSSRIGADGMGNSPRPHPPDHGRVDGGADPPLQAGHRGLPGPGRPGRTSPVESPARRARRATSSPTAAPARTGCTSATRRSSTCRPSPAMCEGGQIADVIAAVASHRPRHGWGRPMIAASARRAPTSSDEERTLASCARSSRATRGRGRRCCRCCTWCRPRRATSRPTGIEVVRRDARLITRRGQRRSRRSTRCTSAARSATTTSASAPTRCARSWAATRSSTGSRTTSASATTRPRADGKVTLEHVECNAACDYAPVVMVNWEFFDNQTPESAARLVDDLRAGEEVTLHPRRPDRAPGARRARARRLPRRPRRRGPGGRPGVAGRPRARPRARLDGPG